MIQDWLNRIEVTYTVGRATMAWNDVRKIVKEMIEDGTFYSDVDADGEKKDPGWLFLNVDEVGDEDEDDDESSFEADSEEESEDESDDSDDGSSYEDEDDDDSEYDDDELSEEGKVAYQFKSLKT